jgi:hypothetical protein
MAESRGVGKGRTSLDPVWFSWFSKGCGPRTQTGQRTSDSFKGCCPRFPLLNRLLPAQQLLTSLETSPGGLLLCDPGAFILIILNSEHLQRA